MTVFARSRSHICCNCLSICSRDCPLSASDSRNTLPARTSSTPAKPSELSECWMALPLGSRADGFSSTVTVAFMARIVWAMGQLLGESRVNPCAPAQLLTCYWKGADPSDRKSTRLNTQPADNLLKLYGR